MTPEPTPTHPWKSPADVPSRTITPSGWGWEWRVSESRRSDRSGHAFTKRAAIRKSALYLAEAVDRHNKHLGRIQ